eukprot:6208842-Pleurochrysis_carterae.AAC.1
MEGADRQASLNYGTRGGKRRRVKMRALGRERESEGRAGEGGGRNGLEEVSQGRRACACVRVYLPARRRRRQRCRPSVWRVMGKDGVHGKSVGNGYGSSGKKQACWKMRLESDGA